MVLAIFLILLPLLFPVSLGVGGISSGNSATNIGGIGNSNSNINSNNNINGNINNGGNGSGSSSSTSANSNNKLGGIGSDTIQLSSRVVHTKYGAVSGVIVHLDGRHLDPVEAFKGIPYASPPVGNLRFMPPVNGALWSGVKRADR